MTVCDGKNSALGFKAGDTVADTDVCDLISESMKDEREVFNESENTLIGGRQENVADAVCTKQNPGGSFTFRPRYSEIEKAFALALCGGTTTLIPVATGELTAFSVTVDKAGAKTEKYSDCVVSELTFSSEQNNPAEIQIDLIAKSCADSSITPDYTSIGGVVPVMHSDLVMTDDIAAGLNIYKYQLHINNNVDSELYGNSATRQVLQAQQFDADLELELDLTASLASAWKTAYVNKTALVLTATYDNETDDPFVIQFSGIITSPLPEITSPGTQKATVTFDGKAVKDAAGAVITNKVEVTP